MDNGIVNEYLELQERKHENVRIDRHFSDKNRQISELIGFS